MIVRSADGEVPAGGAVGWRADLDRPSRNGNQLTEQSVGAVPGNERPETPERPGWNGGL